MESIHCIECGGYVASTRALEYRTRTGRPEAVTPRPGPCTCARPTLFMPRYRQSLQPTGGSSPRSA